MKITNNIVCNNCTGARMYQQLGWEYNNPFMWGVINPKDFEILIKEWNNLNFLNYELKYGELKDSKSFYYIEIDNKVKVFYIHYLKGDYNVPTRISDVDIVYKDIESFIKDKYVTRVKRMLSQNIAPTFLAVIHDNWWFDEKALKQLAKNNNCDNLIIANNNQIKAKNFIKVTHPLDPNEKAIEIISVIRTKYTNNNRTLVFTYCDEKYTKFIPLYCSSILEHNKDVDIEINTNVSELQSNENECIEFIKKQFPKSKIKINYSVNVKRYNGNSNRFLMTPTISDEYVYIGDIDVIHLDKDLKSVHLANMRQMNNVYSNKIRANSNPYLMSGLHFTRYDAMYPLKLSLDIQPSNIDENILFKLVRNKGIRIDFKNQFRPIMGIHISPNRPIGGSTTLPSWETDGRQKEWNKYKKTKTFQFIQEKLDKNVQFCIKEIDKHYNNWKVVYTCISNGNDNQLEQLLLSSYSSKRVQGNKCVLVTNNQTNNILLKNAYYTTYINDIIVVDTPYNNNIADSRFIKTTLRNIIKGDYLAVDVDTIFLQPFDETNAKGEINMVLDFNRKFNYTQTQDIPQYILNAIKKIGVNYTQIKDYHNSGVAFWKDTKNTRYFARKWYKNWLKSIKRNKLFYDQIPLIKTEFDCPNCVYTLSNEYNTMVDYVVEEPIIYHYHKEKRKLTSIFQQIKKQQNVNDNLLNNIKKQCKNFKSLIIKDTSKRNVNELITIVKNDNAILRQWVEYHLNIGFDKIYINDNNDIEGEKPILILKDFIKQGKVVIFNKRGERLFDIAQVTNECLSFCDRSDFVCFLYTNQFINTNWKITNNLSITNTQYNKPQLKSLTKPLATEENTEIFILGYKQFKCPIHNANLYRIVNLNAENTIKNDDEYHYDIPIIYTDKKNSISKMNNIYDEWTGIYWLWKNHDWSKTEYVGLCQYRRYFEFLDNPNWEYLNGAEMNVGQGSTNRQNNNAVDYKKYHNLQDLMDLLRLFTQDDMKSARLFLESNTFFPSNLLILHKKDFFDFCAFVFGYAKKFQVYYHLYTYEQIQERVKKNIDKYPQRDDSLKYQSQMMAFLMERLTNIWISKQLMAKRRIRTLPCVETEHTGQNIFKPLY